MKNVARTILDITIRRFRFFLSKKSLFKDYNILNHLNDHWNRWLSNEPINVLFGGITKNTPINFLEKQIKVLHFAVLFSNSSNFCCTLMPATIRKTSIARVVRKIRNKTMNWTQCMQLQFWDDMVNWKIKNIRVLRFRLKKYRSAVKINEVRIYLRMLVEILGVGLRGRYMDLFVLNDLFIKSIFFGCSALWQDNIYSLIEIWSTNRNTNFLNLRFKHHF